MLTIACFVLNAAYLFEGSGKKLGEFEFCSELLGGQGASSSTTGNRFADGWIANIPIPVPENYLLGIDFLRFESESRYWSYLLGEHRFGGWIYYYIVTICLKSPVATLLAFSAGIVLFVRAFVAGRLNHQIGSTAIVLGIPIMISFLSISSQYGFSHHHRYVLHVYPLMFFMASFLGSVQPVRSSLTNKFFIRSNKLVGFAPKFCARVSCLWRDLSVRYCFITGCVIAMMTESLSVAPHFLSFFNLIGGGPLHGYRLLAFSNVDWGQDLLLVKRWVDENTHCRPIRMATRYGASAEWFGAGVAEAPFLTMEDLPSSNATLEGEWWIVHVEYLRPRPGARGYEWLEQFEPFDRIGYSHKIYHIKSTHR